MKNNKGITFGRIILYILFAFVIVFIIWSLVLTYRKIKNPNTTTKIECDNVSSLRMIQPNGTDFRDVNLLDFDTYPFENLSTYGLENTARLFTGCFLHLPAGNYTLSFGSLPSGIRYDIYASSISGFNVSGNYIYSVGYLNSSTYTFTVSQSFYFGLYCYYANDAVINSSVMDNADIMLNYGSTAASYVPFEDYHYLNGSNYITSANSYISDSTYSIVGNTTYDNVTDIYNYYTTEYSRSWIEFNSTNPNFNYYTINNTLLVGGSINDMMYIFNAETTYPYYTLYNVMNVVFNCDNLPINLFNFSLTGSTLNYSDKVILYFELPNMDNIVYYVNFDSTQKFTSDIITNSMPYVTSLKRFGFLFYLNPKKSAFDVGSYIPELWNEYSCLTQPNIRQRLVDFDLVFDAIIYTPEEQSIYDAGYYDGVRSADIGLANQVTTLNNTISSLNQTISDMNTRINSQTEIINNLQNQINLADNNFKGLFFTFADVPFRTVSNALGFEFFGVNLFRFFVGIITALGLIWLIKKLI